MFTYGSLRHYIPFRIRKGTANLREQGTVKLHRVLHLDKEIRNVTGKLHFKHHSQG